MSCRKNCGKSNCRECTKNAPGLRGPRGPTGPCCTGPTGGAGANNFIQSCFARVPDGTIITTGPFADVQLATCELNFPVASFAEILSTFAFDAGVIGVNPLFRLYVDGMFVLGARETVGANESGSGAVQLRTFLPAGVHTFELRVLSPQPITFPLGTGHATLYVQETLI